MRPPIPQCCADQITVVDQITGGWGVAIIDLAITVMLALIFQCHLQQLKPIRMPSAQGGSVQNMWVFHQAISSNEYLFVFGNIRRYKYLQCGKLENQA